MKLKVISDTDTGDSDTVIVNSDTDSGDTSDSDTEWLTCDSTDTSDRAISFNCHKLRYVLLLVLHYYSSITSITNTSNTNSISSTTSTTVLVMVYNTCT